jgi:hypothetical protein
MRGLMTHPDFGVLAEFRAGLVSGRRAARIAAHLATCGRCAGLADQLAEVSALLAAVPAPVMPDSVAERLDTVLAAEVAHRNYSERTSGDSLPDRMPLASPGQSPDSLPDRMPLAMPLASPGQAPEAPDSRPNRAPDGRRRWDWRLVALRLLAPAAGVVLLAAGGYGLSLIAGGASSTSSRPALASGAKSTAPAAAERGAASPSRIGAGPNVQAPSSFKVVISGTDYQRATLVQQLERELRLHGRGAAGPQRTAPAGVSECVLRVTSGVTPGTLLLVERARFEGRPATVIVAASGDRHVAWVTGSACSSTSEDLLATTTLPGTYKP